LTAPLSGWQWIAGLLLFLCLASFGWAMRRFFVLPRGSTMGAKLVAVAGSVFAGLHFVAIFLGNITPERGGAATLLYLCSLGLFWWAIRANSGTRLSAAFSSDLPVHLVENGPYKFVRHPFYCSYVLAWLAGTIATARWWLIPTVVVMALIYWRAARLEEEKFSESSLRVEYQKYRERTALLVPSPMKVLLARRSTVRTL
jgi:protein-S-isoprenylcysteine O-methyltransferase Ste14